MKNAAEDTIRGQKQHNARRQRQEEFDEFGVLKLMKDDTQHTPTPWFMTQAGTSDSRVGGIGFPSNAGIQWMTGSDNKPIFWKASTDDVWQYVASVDMNSYNSNSISCDYFTIGGRGYMQTADDWKSNEMTIYYQDMGSGSTAQLWFLTRGGTVAASSRCTGGCETNGYGLLISTNGNGQFLKYFNSSTGIATTAAAALGTALTNGNYIGIKFMVYTGGGGYTMEVWSDITTNNSSTPGNGWTKRMTVTDTGSNFCAAAGNYCGGTANQCQYFTWGGPLAKWRFGNTANKAKWMSCREIDPTI